MGLITSKIFASTQKAFLLSYFLFSDRFLRGPLANFRSFGPHIHTTMPNIDLEMSDETLELHTAGLKKWLAEEHLLDPEIAERPTRKFLLSSQQASRQNEILPPHGRCRKRLSIFGLQTQFSKTPLDQLSPISLSEMLVRKRNTGRFLLCRTIVPCTRRDIVQLIVEDPKGNVNAITISNFPTTAGKSLVYLDSLFPVGLVMAIREPTLTRINTSQLPYPVIRVDSPSDIVFLHPKSQILQAVEWGSECYLARTKRVPLHAEDWKALGNKLFRQAHWLPAAIAYSKGLDINPSASLLRLNRADVYLRLGYDSAALADAEHILAVPILADALRIQALSRAAKASYARGDYVVAARKFSEWADLAPLENKEALAGVSRSRTRLKESITGQYDWTRLFKESQRTPRIDLADYVGPVKVTTIESRGGGRGIVATRRICIGEVLVVSKPFISVFPEDLPADEDLLAFDLRGDKFSTRCQTALVSRVVDKIYGNPDQYDNVSSLYCGTDCSPPLSYPPQKTGVLSLSALTPAVDIDVGKIEAICTFNNFTPNSLQLGPHDVTVENPAALYLLPSLFNHACSANAIWHCIGDAMIIRATTDIAEGNEVTIPYACGDSYRERLNALEVYIPNGCDCHLCEEDREDGEEAVKRRERLISELCKSRITQSPALERARELVNEMEATYSPMRSIVRPQMGFARNLIAVLLHELAYEAEERLWPTYFEAAIEEQFLALESVGMKVTDKAKRGPIHGTAMPIAANQIPTFVPHEQCVSHMISLAYSFHVLKERQRASIWIKTAAWVEKMATGFDKEIFLLRYGAALKYHGLYSISVDVL